MVLLAPALPAGTYDLRICCNGVLSGLVIVTGICGFVDPWAAALCGLIAGIAYPLVSHCLVRSSVSTQERHGLLHCVGTSLHCIQACTVLEWQHC